MGDNRQKHRACSVSCGESKKFRKFATLEQKLRVLKCCENSVEMYHVPC